MEQIPAPPPSPTHPPSHCSIHEEDDDAWLVTASTVSCSTPPVPRNRLAQEPPPGSAVKFSHHFFFLPRYWVFHGSGGCRTAIQVCRTTFHVCCYGSPIRGDPISQSQAHIPLKPLPPALDPFPEATSP